MTKILKTLLVISKMLTTISTTPFIDGGYNIINTQDTDKSVDDDKYSYEILMMAKMVTTMLMMIKMETSLWMTSLTV